jgi:cold shock CspA family protein
MTDMDKLFGVVKFWNVDRCYGFIVPDGGGADLFAHISQVSNDCDDPQKGDRVSFIIDKGRDGRPCARQIVVVESAKA